MGTVTAAHAQDTSVEELLEEIRPRKSGQIKDRPERPALLALLLTPTYAQHALTGDLALRMLQRLHGGEPGGALAKPVDIITAVVDRLPSTSGPSTGLEGFSYMFLQNPGPLSVASQSRLRPSAQNAGSLSFDIPTTPHRDSQITIQLPLAQTIFSTGLVSTLVHARYNYTAEGGLVKVSEQQLESQTLRLPFVAALGHISMHTPLVPLTPCRVVRNQMGNIVRALSSRTVREEHDVAPSSSSQPASQELEAAVTQYFKVKAMSPEAVKVWALILPPSAEAGVKRRQESKRVKKLRKLRSQQIHQIWAGTWPRDIQRVVSGMYHLVRTDGGRLHRVLSGGGGWGKKAGLLSLDPDSAYNSRELRVDEGWEFDFDDESEGAVEKQQKQALGEIVREGEDIMFFIAASRPDYEPGKNTEAARNLAETMQWVQRADQAAMFGVVPSTVDGVLDSAVESSSATNFADGIPRVHHHPCLFGALSETGLAMTIGTKNGITAQTKLDVPFSHIRIIEDDGDGERLRLRSLAAEKNTIKDRMVQADRVKLDHRRMTPNPPRAGDTESASYDYFKTAEAGEHPEPVVASAVRGVVRYSNTRRKGSPTTSRTAEADPEFETREFQRLNSGDQLTKPRSVEHDGQQRDGSNDAVPPAAEVSRPKSGRVPDQLKSVPILFTESVPRKPGQLEKAIHVSARQAEQKIHGAGKVSTAIVPPTGLRMREGTLDVFATRLRDVIGKAHLSEADSEQRQRLTSKAVEKPLTERIAKLAAVKWEGMQHSARRRAWQRITNECLRECERILGVSKTPAVRASDVEQSNTRTEGRQLTQEDEQIGVTAAPEVRLHSPNRERFRFSKHIVRVTVRRVNTELRKTVEQKFTRTEERQPTQEEERTGVAAAPEVRFRSLNQTRVRKHSVRVNGRGDMELKKAIGRTRLRRADTELGRTIAGKKIRRIGTELRKGIGGTGIKRIAVRDTTKPGLLMIKRIERVFMSPIRQLLLSPTTLTMRRERERDRQREEQRAIRSEKEKMLARARRKQSATQDVWDMMQKGDAMERLAAPAERSGGTRRQTMMSARRSRALAEDVMEVFVREDEIGMQIAWAKENKTYILFGTTLNMPPPSTGRPRVLLFDIGGVCVVSPFQAILDYEQSKGIPPNWINHSISASSPHGAWQRLERGEILLDAAFFREFKHDLSNETRWRTYYAKHLAATKTQALSDAAEESAYQAPGVPDIDAEWLYWEMMRVARAPDPHMYPALKRLRAAADTSRGQLILAALSNTSIFPPGHPYYDESTPDGKRHTELRGLFDVFISSAHVGMRKPDEDIYRYAVVRVHEFVKTKYGGQGVRAEDITFLDDIGTNLRTAKRLGMKTIKVQLGRAEKAVVELEKITGLQLQDSKSKL
ncbi:hypothetical protein LTR08_004526 [Meristemomyces frigidus]|nr:hypothetical protein LTR08_004526 [Meristemomyces frigidus]